MSESERPPEQRASTAFDWGRTLGLVGVLLAGLSGSHSVVSRTQLEDAVLERTADRWTARDEQQAQRVTDERIQRVIERLERNEADFKRLRDRHDQHIASHPDRGLQTQIHEHIRDGHGP